MCGISPFGASKTIGRIEQRLKNSRPLQRLVATIRSALQEQGSKRS
jgi:hypothetical protein